MDRLTFLRQFFPAILCIAICTQSTGQQSFDSKMKSLYKGTVPLINAEELAGKENAIILDTRSQKEFDVSHIEGSRLIDYETFSKSDVKKIDKSAEVIVYCSVGYRSERIGEKLLKMGFTDVKNLYGGIFDWKNRDFEVVNTLQNPTDSIHTFNKKWSQWLYKGIKVYE